MRYFYLNNYMLLISVVGNVPRKKTTQTFATISFVCENEERQSFFFFLHKDHDDSQPGPGSLGEAVTVLKRERERRLVACWENCQPSVLFCHHEPSSLASSAPPPAYSILPLRVRVS